MKKIDKIDGCWNCPLKQCKWSGGFYCTHQASEDRTLSYDTLKLIPDWCPLPEDD